MREHVVVNEVGLRDGLQNQPKLVPTEGKLELARALIAAGIRHFEATSFVSPKAVPQMADAAELFPRLPDPGRVSYMALVPNEKGYERAKAAGAQAISVVLSATEMLNRKNINMSLGQATEVCETVVRRAKADGITARAYVAAACACPYEGPTPPEVVFDLARRMFAAGADEVAIADTTGAGNPVQVKHLFAGLVAEHGPARLAGHFHDTRGMGLVLAWAAMECGVRRFDSSIGGLGGCPFAPGASGNLATEDLVFMLNESGYETGVDFDRLVRAIGVAERLTGQKLGGKIMPWYAAQQQRAARAAG